MPRVRGQADWPAGRVVQLQHQSQVLRDNPWGDPADRLVPVYLPHGYNEQSQPLVALWDLAAYTNSGPGHIAWRNHGENLPQRLDRLIGQGHMPPAVVVMPDCYSSLGGNQYINSVGVGRYADYLVQELVPFISSRVNVVNQAVGRAVFGKSSGGYGALYHAMHFPGTWGAVAAHAPDTAFDLLFRPVFPDTCLHLEKFNLKAESFIRKFWESKNPSGRDFTTLMILAMAASYDPDPQNPGNIRLPFDLHTCELNEVRWNKWLAFDLVNLVADHVKALHSLKALYLDVGSYDQYNIQFGTRQLAARFKDHQVPFHFEEFNGNHSGMDWRLDYPLPFLVQALNSAAPDANSSAGQ
jgi:enterochelin esterase-like enzyme